MITVLVKPKSKLVTTALIFQDMGSFKTYCEDEGICAESFEATPYPMNERKYLKLPRFDGEMKKGWM